MLINIKQHFAKEYTTPTAISVLYVFEPGTWNKQMKRHSFA